MSKKIVRALLLIFTLLLSYGLGHFLGFIALKNEENQRNYRLNSVEINQGTGFVKDFQSLGKYGIAISAVGDVQITNDVITAATYRFKESNQGYLSIEDYVQDKNSYYYLDVYDTQKGIASHRRVDVKQALLDYDSNCIIVDRDTYYEGTNIFIHRDSGAKYQRFSVAFLGVAKAGSVSGAEPESLYLNLDTLKIEKLDENRLTSLDSCIYDSRQERGLYERILNADLQDRVARDKNSQIQGPSGVSYLKMTMLPYQEGLDLQIYQKFPHIKEMAQAGFYEIYPADLESDEERDEFMALFEKVQDVRSGEVDYD